MFPRRRRVSHGLIGVLIIAVSLGLILYFHNTSPSKANDSSGKPAPAAAVAQVEVKPKPPEQAKPQDPTTRPADPTTRPAAMVSKDVLITGKKKLDSGDLLGARSVLSAALVAGTLSPDESAQCKQMLGTISDTVIFSPRKFADDEFGGTYSVQPGDVLQKIAKAHDVTSEFLCTINGLSDPRKLRAGATLKVIQGPFHAIVTKKTYDLEVWLGEPYAKDSIFIKTWKVGLGKDDSTPAGKWLVQPGNKLKNPTYYSPRGEGVIEANDPKNPLGEYWIGITGIDGHAVGKMSYGIHGTIDPASIGRMESHGCIRMMNDDAKNIFELMVEGKSTVIVRE